MRCVVDMYISRLQVNHAHTGNWREPASFGETILDRNKAVRLTHDSSTIPYCHTLNTGRQRAPLLIHRISLLFLSAPLGVVASQGDRLASRQVVPELQGRPRKVMAGLGGSEIIS